MPTPTATRTQLTTDHSARTSGPLNMIVLHHGATTSLEQIVALMMPGGRQVSAHRAIKDAQNVETVPEAQRAWSLSDAYWDSRAFTVECANESTVGWTISSASHETLAQQCASWAKRWGFPIIRSGDPKTWTLIGHREVYSIWGGSYATACPGGMNLDWIAQRANEILNQSNRKKDSVTTNFSVTLASKAEADQLDPVIKSAMTAQKVPALSTFPVVLTAMCGDSSGTLAGALFVNGNSGKSIADHFIAQHGAALACNLPTFNGIVVPYLTPIVQPISGNITATSTPDPAVAAELAKQTELLGSMDNTLKQPVGPLP